MRRRPSASGDDDDSSSSPGSSKEKERPASENPEREREREVVRRPQSAKDKDVSASQTRGGNGRRSGGGNGMKAHQRRQSQDVLSPRASREQQRPPPRRQASGTSEPQAPERSSVLETSPVSSEKRDLDGMPRPRASQRSPWACSWLTLGTTACALLVLFTIIQSFSTRQQDPSGCAMSYMMPMFARFNDFDTEHTRFASKYSLYLYREGGVDEDSRVKGIPVLFIPGNAGSYKQVRPVAAEAAHYFQDVLRNNRDALRAGKRTLDFFSVDFNEDITAFHGQTLLDQAEYLNEAVAFILSLYANPGRSLREPGLPDVTSVILLGHSMGGVVARTMLRMSNYQANTINTILTLSAPHARAPVSFDAQMVSTYQDVNTFWRQSYSQASSSANPLRDVSVVSIAGGGLDTMIPSEYTTLSSLVPASHGFTVFTSTIPTVWTGMDHLAIMWCDQFRKALVKAMYDVVDVRRPSQTRPQSERIAAMRLRLLTGMEDVTEKALLSQDSRTLLLLESSSDAIMSQGDRLVLRALGTEGQLTAHVMPIPAKAPAKGSRFTLLTNHRLDAQGENGTLEVLFCSIFPLHAAGLSAVFATTLDISGGMSGSTRLACKNAAADNVLLPASTNESRHAFDPVSPFSYLQYDYADLTEHQFVAVVDKQTSLDPQGWLIAEFTLGSESTVVTAKGHHQLFAHDLRVILPENGPMMTDIRVPELHSNMLAYTLEIKRSPCLNNGRASGESELFAPLLRQHMSEPYESKYFPNIRRANINLHGISPFMPPPLSSATSFGEGLSMQTWTDPTCNSTMEVSLSVDVLGSAGKLVMRYRTVFAAFPLLVVAIVVRKQFKIYDATSVFISFAESMDDCITTSVPTIFVALTFLAVSLSKASQGSSWVRNWLNSAISPFSSHSSQIDFTANDLLLGSQDPFFWFLVPLFGLVSIGVCMALHYIALAIIHAFAFLYGRLRPAGLTREDGSRGAPSGFAVTTPQQRIATTSVLLLLVMTVIPYQFAYMVLCIVQMATCVRALRLARDTHSVQNYNFYNYAYSVLAIMLWVLPINMPVLIVWIHNLAVHWLTPFSTHHNLVSVLPYILLVEMLSAGHMVPRVTSRLRHVTNTLTFALAVYAAVYGVSYAYRLHHFVNAFFAWLVLLHLSSSPTSITRFTQWARGDGRVKKRP